jgi:hypothetical protein
MMINDVAAVRAALELLEKESAANNNDTIVGGWRLRELQPAAV